MRWDGRGWSGASAGVGLEGSAGVAVGCWPGWRWFHGVSSSCTWQDYQLQGWLGSIRVCLLVLLASVVVVEGPAGFLLVVLAPVCQRCLCRLELREWLAVRESKGLPPDQMIFPIGM